MAKAIDVVDENIAQKKGRSLSEIGKNDAVDPVSDGDFVKKSEKAAFMNEQVKILVHESQGQGDLDVICPKVNQVNQPIVRGVETWVKRKYVEALARGRSSKVEQKMNPMEREKIQIVERSSLLYPFSVLEDPNPRGQAWLKAILAEQ